MFVIDPYRFFPNEPDYQPPGSNLKFWVDPSDSSTVLLSGSNVQTLEDKSPAGRSVNRVSTGPVLESINGLQAIGFNGNESSRLESAPYTGPIDFALNQTFLGVCQYDSIDPRGFWLQIGSANLGNPSNGSTTARFWTFVSTNTIANAVITNVPLLWGFRIKPDGTYSAFVNDKVLNSSGETPPSIQTTARIVLGYAGTGPLNGKIGEIMFWEEALSDFDFEDVKLHLANKWGATI